VGDEKKCCRFRGFNDNCSRGLVDSVIRPVRSLTLRVGRESNLTLQVGVKKPLCATPPFAGVGPCIVHVLKAIKQPWLRPKTLGCMEKRINRCIVFRI